MDMEQYAEKLYVNLKKSFPDEEINAINVFGLIRLAMEEAERFQELAGRQKKELVIRVIHEAIEDYVLDDIENQNIRILVDHFMDVIIDNFVDIDLNHLKINEENKKKLKKIFYLILKNRF